ncbi:hypothetical protein A8926_5618 [Saccharopolyspora spinosa]|uniref:Uncharacterized protein n=1 Tax=Saccharopolyspora spinosa TaxID=60894 RepID=A0A2N3Y481_SACSN|nr:hypothetical protein A8926_5618 [Saccharopolyspora spinosa]
MVVPHAGIRAGGRPFILGIWIPLSTTSIPTSLRMASNSSGDLLSLFWISNRALQLASLRSITRFLAA